MKEDSKQLVFSIVAQVRFVFEDKDDTSTKFIVELVDPNDGRNVLGDGGTFHPSGDSVGVCLERLRSTALEKLQELGELNGDKK